VPPARHRCTAATPATDLRSTETVTASRVSRGWSRPRRRAAAAALALLVIGMLWLVASRRGDEAAAVRPVRGVVAPAASINDRIDALEIAPSLDPSTYARDLFGGAWIDADSDGCDTRCEVLARQSRTDLPGLPIGWLSSYDGYSTDDASELDVDHVVPLAEAWVSGAVTWDGPKRIAFANDLVDPELVAVTAAANRSKGDRDPARWQPSSDDAWCGYASAWVDVKLHWELTADAAEVAALRNMAARC
jgi:hypothetical protein